jgi:hypothetical protein
MAKQYKNGRSWNKIVLVDDPRDSDVMMFIDCIPNEIKTNKKTIFLQREPEYVKPIPNNLSLFDHVVTYEKYPSYVDWWLDDSYQNLATTKYKKRSKNEPICITSLKNQTSGQVKRLQFLRKHQNKCLIDFCGKKNIANIFNNYKGIVEQQNKSLYDLSILEQYNVSISLENGVRKNFFTRIVEPLLCWTLPVYYGCPNLDEIVDNNSYRSVDVESDLSTEELSYLFRPPSILEIESMEYSRGIIMNKFNFFPFVEKIIEENL